MILASSYEWWERIVRGVHADPPDVWTIYSSAIGGCYICGHSVNQNGDYGDTKKLVAGKVKIYRVRTSVIVGGTERRVSIPVSGNEATVINDTFW